MKYWKAVLHEVLNKDNERTEFRYTNLGESRKENNKNKQKNAYQNQNRKKRVRKMYYLGKKYEGLYLTHQEGECMNLLLQDHTIVSTAKDLNLSARTVEFYVKNMKLKLSCATKKELVNKIAETDFLKNYQALMRKDKDRASEINEVSQIDYHY